jgi:hypothetical protein
MSAASKVKAQVTADGELRLTKLSFRPETEVEVEVREVAANDTLYPFWGIPVHYENPSEPLQEDSWEALR